MESSSRKRARADVDADAAREDASPRKAVKTNSKERSVATETKGKLKSRGSTGFTQHVKNARSLIGKAGQKMLAAGKRKIGDLAKAATAPAMNAKQSKLLRELDTGTRGLLDEMDLDAMFPVERPKKMAKKEPKAAAKETQAPPATFVAPLPKLSGGKPAKKWLDAGLYVGQRSDADPAHLYKKSTTSAPAKEPFMPLPMWKYLDKNERDFFIPFDVFAPSLKKGDEKPKDWHKINRNRLVGDAKELWEKNHALPMSVCVCPDPAPGELGCGEDCLNRVMQYECNAENCCLSAAQCGNRAFAELAIRVKKGGAFDVGVEVVKTENRGFGIRATRCFAPGQIIMEYTGEVISEGECQRRMRDDYKDKSCYYLMELERGLVIDGTKGSMARFINHSCDPNCEVRMVKVNGTPRMAVYAGDNGIKTGQELTYDYNFDNFGEVRQHCYCGAATCRGFLSKRLNATEQKKQFKEQEERRRLAAIEAQKAAEREAKKKEVKKSRGSNWRGWVSVDDAEVKEQLRAEKRAREEAQKSSSRAQRLAARSGGGPAVKPAAKPAVKANNATPQRRQTIGAVEKDAAKGAKESKPLKPSAASNKRRHTVGDALDRSSEHLETPAPKKHQRASPSSEGSKENKPVPASEISVRQTTITVNVQEVEIRQQESISKGNVPVQRTSSIKLKQSTLNFAKIG